MSDVYSVQLLTERVKYIRISQGMRGLKGDPATETAEEVARAEAAADAAVAASTTAEAAANSASASQIIAVDAGDDALLAKQSAEAAAIATAEDLSTTNANALATAADASQVAQDALTVATNTTATIEAREEAVTAATTATEALDTITPLEASAVAAANQTQLDVAQTQADVITTDSDASQTSSDRVQTGNDAASAMSSATSAANSLAAMNKGQPNGVTPLNGAGLIDQQYLPSYVDDVLEYPNVAAFPAIGETGKLYIETENDGTYRWAGSTYVEISSSMSGADIKALYEGEPDTNAFNDALKTKLESVEPGATADQTGAEIKAAYEAEPNTNAFTDSDKTKLSGIEAGADVSAVDSVDGRTGAVTLDDLYATSAQGIKADTAHGWGNHASAGYAPGSSVQTNVPAGAVFTDTIYTHPANHSIAEVSGLQGALDGKATSVQGANADTAHGWGDHASAGYLASSSYTAADVLAKLKTVDGSGSGLDADMLDGLGSDKFLRSNTNDTMTGTLETRSGIHGGYGNNHGTGTNWGSTIWGMGTSYDGSGFGSTFSNTGMYGLAWIRGAHASVNSNIGEGLHLFQAGNLKGGIGQNGVYTVGTVVASGGNSTNWNTAYGWGDHASAGYLPATGKAADSHKLNGASMSVSSTADSVVQRNGNGYVFATYFNSSAGFTTATPTGIWVETDSDGYHRKMTPANLRNNIGALSTTGTAATATKVTNQNTGTLKFWTGTQAQYDALTPDANTQYTVVG